MIEIFILKSSSPYWAVQYNNKDLRLLPDPLPDFPIFRNLHLFKYHYKSWRTQSHHLFLDLSLPASFGLVDNISFISLFLGILLMYPNHFRRLSGILGKIPNFPFSFSRFLLHLLLQTLYINLFYVYSIFNQHFRAVATFAFPHTILFVQCGF